MPKEGGFETRPYKSRHRARRMRERIPPRARQPAILGGWLCMHEWRNKADRFFAHCCLAVFKSVPHGDIPANIIHRPDHGGGGILSNFAIELRSLTQGCC